jgi:polyphenol oxidase
LTGKRKFITFRLYSFSGNHMQGEIMLRPITSPLIDNSVFNHAFFTRQGGVSQGIYSGLNVGIGSNDDRAHVHENRQRAAGFFNLPPDRLISPWQVHSPDTVVVDKPFEGERPKADGIVTATPGIAIAAVTADCGPILFSDAKKRIIGAAHAGWKGALYGVIESTIAAMVSLGSQRENIVAVLGPSISQKNYEVGPEFVGNFVSETPENQRYFVASQKPGHSMFDLWAYTVDRLQKAGVKADCVNACTYDHEDQFYSYRRTTHRQEPDYGRQMSAIMLKD